MAWIRTTAVALALFSLVPAHLAPTSASSATSLSSSVSGMVKDEAGRVLEGVEVLVVGADGKGNDAPVRALSDARGRFFVVAIAPGVYRIAAIKSGYIAALGVVNTVLRSSVDLVLRPIPKGKEPGAESVLPDLSWTLRIPPRSVLQELGAAPLLASKDKSAVREFAARVEDAVRGEVDHVFAVGSWSAGSAEPAASVSSNETHMRLAGTLGERGAIQVHGRRGTLDSSSPHGANAVSRGASDIDLDVSYDTNVDERLAMRAFYSAGDLQLDDTPGIAGVGSRQSQRSFGYDAKWRKEVDASSRVAVQVGLQDSNLDRAQGLASGWGAGRADAWNRAIGAEGSYENLVGDGHLVRLGVRAQRLSLEAPELRASAGNGGFGLGLDGAVGWNLLIDTDDQWSISGPLAMTYGLSVRQGFDGSAPTALTPRVGGSFTAGRMEAQVAVSHVSTAHRSPYGYEIDCKARLDAATTLRGTASYVPSRADVWDAQGLARSFQTPYVSDGFASDRVVALELARVAPNATVAFRVARGRAEGILAPALDEAPVVLLSPRTLGYDAARLSVTAPRAGSAVSVEYRGTKDVAGQPGIELEDELRTLDLEFAQDLVRFGGGRAFCRLLVTARAALRSADYGLAEDNRFGAGFSLAF